MRLIAIMDVDEGFGAILELAQSLGWEDTHGDATSGSWTPEDADACEGAALEYLRGERVVVVDGEGEVINGI